MAASPLIALCQTEFASLTAYGNDFMLLALIAAIIATVLSCLERVAAVFRKPTTRLADDNSAAPSTVIDSIRNLIVALGSAPAWIVIFFAAALLLWMAPTRYGAGCSAPPPAAR